MGGWDGRFKRAPGSQVGVIYLLENPCRAELGATICRCARHFRNAYPVWIDWSVNEFEKAKHPPRPVLNGDDSLRPLELKARPGQRIKLDATGGSDIHSDTLAYNWNVYPEAGTFSGEVEIGNNG